MAPTPPSAPATTLPEDFVPTSFQRFLLAVLRPRKQWLWHPNSPGVKVLVVRTWVGRMFKPRDSATTYERRWTDSPTLWVPLLSARKH